MAGSKLMFTFDVLSCVDEMLLVFDFVHFDPESAGGTSPFVALCTARLAAKLSSHSFFKVGGVDVAFGVSFDGDEPVFMPVRLVRVFGMVDDCDFASCAALDFLHRGPGICNDMVSNRGHIRLRL